MEASRLEAKTTPLTLMLTSLTPRVLMLISLSVACLAFVALFFARRKLFNRGTVLLLVGPSDAGKTAILSTLVYGQTLPTHTSLQINQSVFSIPDTHKVIRAIDVPGHPRVRDLYQHHLTEARVVGFVVDASTVSRNGTAVAEHLHRVLHAFTSLPPSQIPPKLLIIAHKSDLIKSASSSSETLAVSRVKTILERELEKRRVSQTGGVAVEGLGAEGESSEMSGLECAGKASAFQFEAWEGGEINFVGTSCTIVTANEMSEKSGLGIDGLSSLKDWLAENF